MKFSFLQALFLYKRWKCSSVSRSPWPSAWFKVFNEQSHAGCLRSASGGSLSLMKFARADKSFLKLLSLTSTHLIFWCLKACFKLRNGHWSQTLGPLIPAATKDFGRLILSRIGLQLVSHLCESPVAVKQKSLRDKSLISTWETFVLHNFPSLLYGHSVALRSSRFFVVTLCIMWAPKPSYPGDKGRG